MSEVICTCHCGGSMFYRHMHAESCELSRVGEEAPKSELQALRDEVARLTRRAGDLEGRFKMVGKYMGNGRMQQAHDLVKDTIVAIYMTEPKQAALTPQAGKGGGA